MGLAYRSDNVFVCRFEFLLGNNFAFFAGEHMNLRHNLRIKV